MGEAPKKSRPGLWIPSTQTFLSPAGTLHTKNIPESRLSDDAGPQGTRLELQEYLVPRQCFRNVNNLDKDGGGGWRRSQRPSECSLALASS